MDGIVAFLTACITVIRFSAARADFETFVNFLAIGAGVVLVFLGLVK